MYLLLVKLSGHEVFFCILSKLGSHVTDPRVSFQLPSCAFSITILVSSRICLRLALVVSAVPFPNSTKGPTFLKSHVTAPAFIALQRTFSLSFAFLSVVLSVPCLPSCLSANGPTIAAQVPRTLLLFWLRTVIYLLWLRCCVRPFLAFSSHPCAQLHWSSPFRSPITACILLVHTVSQPHNGFSPLLEAS